ncbi:MAG: hypothetical protein F4030_00700 [Gammaproteobacteria bacterium]|nr:hypothetical protein [Gammaproteobacteria bacterium]MYH46360.1 hypothetical protein [Gammaproteobacteria bacterium]MYH84292.1 hypothetical protein [Gammaproteobacteria bacterium]MYK03489.1 hypothetical protein [Gammaproteobacteria bacterium]MYL14159.1 hypothetical protein [Gammaproteobacteria bacterium]
MTLPDGWLNKPLAEVAQVVMGQSPDSKYYSSEEIGLPFLQGCAEFQGRHPQHAIYCSRAGKIGCAGSILLSVRAPVGRLNVANRDYVIGRGLAALNGTRVTQDFLEHFLVFQESKFRLASQGSTFEAINSSELKQWPILYPKEKAEQAKIAEVLSTLDLAIKQTEALIAKQQRIKKGLMQDLLTRGIDEHGNLRSEQTHEFKDSQLGRIPVEWEVRCLNQCVHADAPICYGILMPGQGVDYGVPVIKVKDIVGGLIVRDNLLLTDPRIDRQYQRSRLRSGDLVITIRGTTGRVAVVPPELDGANITQDTARVRLSDNHSARFYFYCLQSKSAQVQIELYTIGQAVKGINIRDVRLLLLAMPSPNEQERLANRLDDLEKTIFATSLASAKLKSTKAGLMKDLLTGDRRVAALIGKPKELVDT